MNWIDTAWQEVWARIYAVPHWSKLSKESYPTWMDALDELERLYEESIKGKMQY